MLRQSSDPGSPFYAIFVTPSNGITVQYRAAPGGSIVSMTYRSTDQMQRTAAGGSTYQYEATGIASMTTSGGTTYVTTTPDGEVISERIPSGSQAGTYYYLHDGLGSVVALTDHAGNIVDSYSYDPYGNATSVSETVPNPFRFIGAIWDSSTQLYEMGGATTIPRWVASPSSIPWARDMSTRTTIRLTSRILRALWTTWAAVQACRAPARPTAPSCRAIARRQWRR